MGIALLEERFQQYKKEYPQNIPALTVLARQISGLQIQIRKLFEDITPSLCSACEVKCCSGMPIDGWFTAEDYFAYRMLYDVPEVLEEHHAEQWNCSFLSPDGCFLPEDMRPLACVKVNCQKLNQVLEEQGARSQFKQLSEAIDDIQTKLWELVGNNEE